MRVFRIPQRPVEAFASVGVLMQFLPPLTAADAVSVHVAHVAAGGTLGRHPAVRRQVFAVVAGEGEAQTDDGPRVPLRAGMLVVWEPGETHQTWAVTDLTAVVVETSGGLDLSQHVAEVSP
ncbi:cupin domain-containing protein [Cellulomonas sp. Marseille-Q8402]